ncbi:MAG: hypothetical protein ACFCVG_00680 [Kineosporiaceae bacterium]
MTTSWTRATAAEELNRLSALVAAAFPGHHAVVEQLRVLSDAARLGVADRGLMAAGAHEAARWLPDGDAGGALRSFARVLDV